VVVYINRRLLILVTIILLARGKDTPGERVFLGGFNARKLGHGIFLGLVSKNACI